MKSAIWLCVASFLVGGVTGWKARDGAVTALEREVNAWSVAAVDAEYLMPNFTIETTLSNRQIVWRDQTTGKIFWCPSADDCKWRDRNEAERRTPTSPITCQSR